MRLLRVLSTFTLLAAAAHAAVQCVPSKSTAAFKVALSRDTLAVAQAVICPGATVTAVWSGTVVPPATIVIGAGSSLTITGSGVEAIADGKSLRQLFSVLAGGVLSVTGLTLRNGFSSTQGGAVAADVNTTVTFANSVLELNTANTGAAIFTNSSLILDQVQVLNNTGLNCPSCNGGAILMDGLGSLTATDSYFAGNILKDQANLDITSAFGGAVMISNAAAAPSTVTNCTFVENVAQISGAGMFTWAPLTISNSTFSKNLVSYGAGGGLTVGGGGTVQSCNFTENAAGAYAGGALLKAPTVVIDCNFLDNNGGEFGGGALVDSLIKFYQCRFVGNIASKAGGALCADPKGVIEVYDSEFTGNRANQLYSSFETGDGGAVYMQHNFDNAPANLSTLLARNCSFNRNHAEKHGGAIASLVNSAVTVESCTFTGNEALRGGAIYAAGEYADIFDSEFTANTCIITEAGDTPEGGALAVAINKTMTVKNCSVSLNTAQAGDGGAVLVNGAFVADAVTFTNNSCAGRGGAIVAFAGSVALTDSVFAGHFAGQDGGALYSDVAVDVTVDSVACHMNSADRFGGAMLISGGATITSSNFTNGSAITGAAFYIQGSSASFTNCELRGNVALANGGAIFAAGKSGSIQSKSTKILIEKSLVSENVAVSGGAVACDVDATVTMNTCHILNNRAVTEGGAFSVDGDGLVALNKCLVHDNTATNQGGAVAADVDSTFTAVDTSFKRCSAILGGAIQSAGQLQFTSVDFDSNAAQQSGGALHVTAEGRCNATKSTFTHNQCDFGNGGGVFIGHTAAFDECSFESNQASGNGGAVYFLETKQLSFAACSFSNNSARTAGGGVFGSMGALPQLLPSPSPSRFSNNSAGCCYAQGYGSSADWAERNHTCADLDNGSAVTAQCCAAGFYTTGQACAPCDSNFDCTAVGVTVANAPLKAGLWRSDLGAFTVYKCWHAGACAGGRALSSVDDYCATGYEGPYCAVCSEGYTRSAPYHCSECTGGYKSGATALFLAIIGASICVLWYIISDLIAYQTVAEAAPAAPQAPQSRISALIKLKKRALSSCNLAGQFAVFSKLPWSKLRVPLVVFQILTQYLSVSGLRLPDMYMEFLGWIDILNMNFGAVLNLTCVVLLSFYQRLLLMTLVPLVVLAALFVTYSIVHKRVAAEAAAAAAAATDCSSSSSGVDMPAFGDAYAARLQKALTKHHTVFLVTTFLIYSTVSTVIFQTFACDTIEPSKGKFLRADYSVSCSTTEHYLYQVYAAIMVLIYPVGIPALYAVRMWPVRHILHPHAARSSSGSSSDDLESQDTTPLTSADNSGSSVHTELAVVNTTSSSNNGSNSSSARSVVADGSQIAAVLVTDAVAVPAAVTTTAAAAAAATSSQQLRVQETRFLWTAYKPQLYYWEVIECCRRLLLTGFIVFVFPGSAGQAAVACVIAVGSMVVAAQQKPFADPTDTVLYMVGCVIIFLSMFMSLLIRVDIAKENSHSQKVFSSLLIALSVFMAFAALLQIGLVALPVCCKSRNGALQRLRRRFLYRNSSSSNSNDSDAGDVGDVDDTAVTAAPRRVQQQQQQQQHRNTRRPSTVELLAESEIDNIDDCMRDSDVDSSRITSLDDFNRTLAPAYNTTSAAVTAAAPAAAAGEIELQPRQYIL